MYSTLGYNMSSFQGTTISELTTFLSNLNTKVENSTEEIKEDTNKIPETSEEAATQYEGDMDRISDATSEAASAVTENPIVPEVETSFIDVAIGKIKELLSLIGQAAGAALGINVPSTAAIKSNVRSTAVSLKNVARPMATGGVIPPNKPFLAMLGDQNRGTNVEAPLSTITQAVNDALNSRGFGTMGGGNQEIVLNIDGTTLARVTVPYNLEELNRKGYNVKVLERK